MGETWHAADSKAAALDAAREEAIREMRSSGHRHTSQFLATKYDVDVSVAAPHASCDSTSDDRAPVEQPAAPRFVAT